MKAEEAKRLKELEQENKRHKELVAELTLDMKYVAEKNWSALPGSERRARICKSGSRFPSEGRAECWISREARSDTRSSRGTTSGRWRSGCWRWRGVVRGGVIGGSPGSCDRKAGGPATRVSIGFGASNLNPPNFPKMDERSSVRAAESTVASSSQIGHFEIRALTWPRIWQSG